MQTAPPKYQDQRAAAGCNIGATPEKRPLIPLDHEEEAVVPAIPISGTAYAKDCIPLENNCNVTVVTGGGRRAHMLDCGSRLLLMRLTALSRLLIFLQPFLEIVPPSGR